MYLWEDHSSCSLFDHWKRVERCEITCTKIAAGIIPLPVGDLWEVVGKGEVARGSLYFGHYVHKNRIYKGPTRRCRRRKVVGKWRWGRTSKTSKRVGVDCWAGGHAHCLWEMFCCRLVRYLIDESRALGEKVVLRVLWVFTWKSRIQAKLLAWSRKNTRKPYFTPQKVS